MTNIIYVGMALSLAAALTLSAHAKQAGYDRYDVILKRKPFGALPERPVESAVAAPPEVLVDPENPPRGAFIESLRICALTETDFGLRVGIVDIKSKPQAVYFLYPGESENGLMVMEADFPGERALLRKGEEAYWLGMNDPAGAKTASSTVTAGKGGAVAKATESKRLSYADKLSKRRELEAKRLEALTRPAEITGEALQEHLRNMQMEALRSGAPALPIPLTQEMDDILVEEGVLPAMAE